MGLHQTEEFYTVKDSISRTKRQSTEWEKIFSNLIYNKDLISKICKGLIQLNIKETNNLVKNGQRI